MKTPRVRVLLIGCLLAPLAAVADLARRKDAVVDVVQKASPAVVYVGTISVQRFSAAPNPFFEEFFGIESDRRQAVESLGSGVIIDPSGIVLTNEHVIRGASAIHVVLADGRQLDADVIGSDADNDLAVLKVAAKSPLPFAKLSSASDLMIGEAAIAIGSPFGLKKTVTVGVVSAVGRSFKAAGHVYNDFIQTDASINPGNSGGPLLNIDGEVIGINTAIFAGGQGIGFAIPADKVRRIVAELTQFGKVRPAWVGITVSPVTPALAQRLRWDRTYGALIVGIEQDSPAAGAGVQRGDIVTQVGSSQIEDARDFDERMRGYPANTPIRMSLFRDGAFLEVAFNASEFPAKLAESLAWDRLGLRVRASSQGLSISAVRAGYAAARIGLAPADILLRLNNQPLPSLDAFRETLVASRASRSVLLLVRRGPFAYHITLPF